MPRTKADPSVVRLPCPEHPGSLIRLDGYRLCEWGPAHRRPNDLRPDQVTRASARKVVWRCEFGHEWAAAVYQRTLSGSGCPECYRLEAAARSKAGRARARRARDEAEAAKIISLGERLSRGETG